MQRSDKVKRNIEEPLKSISPYRKFTLKYLYGYRYKHDRRKGKRNVKSKLRNCYDKESDEN